LSDFDIYERLHEVELLFAFRAGCDAEGHPVDFTGDWAGRCRISFRALLAGHHAQGFFLNPEGYTAFTHFHTFCLYLRLTKEIFRGLV